MKFSMMSYTMSNQCGHKLDIKELCAFTKETGLKAIDMFGLYGYTPGEIKQITDGAGLKIICYTFGADINFPDAISRQAGIDEIKRGIEAAAVGLGTDKIMLPLTGKKEFTREQSRRNMIPALQEAVMFGKKAGITVTVEHFPWHIAPFIISADFEEVLKEVPDLRITYDNGNNFIGGEDPCEGFLRMKDYIVHAHFKDWLLFDDDGCMLGLNGHYYKPALIGEGEVNYPAVIRTMEEAGYDGYVNIEYEGTEYKSKDAVRKALDNLRQWTIIE